MWHQALTGILTELKFISDSCRVIESTSLVPVLFREVFSHPYIFFFHLLVNGFSVIGRANRAPHWGVQSRFHVMYTCIYVCLSWSKKCRRITWAKCAHAQSQHWAVKSDQ